MKIQKQNKRGSWDTLVEGTPRRLFSDWGHYIFELEKEIGNKEKYTYRITLDAQDLEKIKKESFT